MLDTLGERTFFAHLDLWMMCKIRKAQKLSRRQLKGVTGFCETFEDIPKQYGCQPYYSSKFKRKYKTRKGYPQILLPNFEKVVHGKNFRIIPRNHISRIKGYQQDTLNAFLVTGAGFNVMLKHALPKAAWKKASIPLEGILANESIERYEYYATILKF